MTKHKPQSFEIKNRSLLSKFFKRNTILSERNVSVHFRFFGAGLGEASVQDYPMFTIISQLLVSLLLHSLTTFY